MAVLSRNDSGTHDLKKQKNARIPKPCSHNQMSDEL